MFILITFSIFINNKSEIAHILSKGNSEEQAMEICDKYLLQGLTSRPNKIEITLFNTGAGVGLKILYFDYQKYASNPIGEFKPRIIPENEYDSLPLDANSLAINISLADAHMGLSSVPEHIWQYIKYRGNKNLQLFKWNEIDFNAISWNLANCLGVEFLQLQSDYITALFPQWLFIKRTPEDEILVMKATITNRDDVARLQRFLEANKKSITRLAIIISRNNGVTIPFALQSLPSPDQFENIELFTIIDAAESEQNIEFLLYDLKGKKILASNLSLSYLFINPKNSIMLDKLELSVNSKTVSVAGVVNSMVQNQKNIGLFHIYMDNKEQFIQWSPTIFELSTANIILEHNLYDTAIDYCRIFQAKRDYVAIEPRGAQDWYTIVRTDLKYYRASNGESELYGEASKSQLMEILKTSKIGNK